MEMGSGSEAASTAPNASIDSVNGLMFGKKIYFEDVASGGNSSSSSSPYYHMEAASLAPPPPQKKGKGVAHEREGKGQPQQQKQPPPRCQVEGCKVDLTGAKTYYCRHKVCGMHSKSPAVIIGGIEQRFCQQCSRFHLLQEFDQGKRSCRRRLAGHNERRRKPPPGPLSPRFGRLSSSLCEDAGSRYQGFLMDFTYPRSSVRAIDRVASVNQWQGDPSTQPCVLPSHHYTSGFQQSECYAGVSDSSCALSLLSSQAWGNTVVPRNRAPNLTTNVSTLDSGRMSEPMIVPNSCMVHPWVFKSHGAGGSTSNHEMQPEMGLGVHFHNDGQFSSELELALQGNGHCPDHGPVRAYDHSGHGVHWSL